MTRTRGPRQGGPLVREGLGAVLLRSYLVKGILDKKIGYWRNVYNALFELKLIVAGSFDDFSCSFLNL